MFNMLKPLAISALLLAGVPAIAQDTTPDAAPDSTTVETTADPDPATTTVAVEDLTPGTPYIRETYNDWAMRCLKAEEGNVDPCQLYQLLNDADGNSVAELSLFPLPTGGAAAAGVTIVVPLETLLNEQLQLSVDGTSTRRYPFTFCNRAGCVARVGFTAAEINQFKRGNAATLRMVPAASPEDEVVLNISLSGFTAGYDAADE